MKVLGLFIAAILISFQAQAADSCVNLTGIYRVDEINRILITQDACQSLRIEEGQILQGQILWNFHYLNAPLDGSSGCVMGGCASAKIYENTVALLWDREMYNYERGGHGGCYYKSETYIFYGKSIRRSRYAYKCKDGYLGFIDEVFSRIE